MDTYRIVEDYGTWLLQDTTTAEFLCDNNTWRVLRFDSALAAETYATQTLHALVQR